LLASEEPELEFVCGALSEIGERGMPVEADSVWEAFTAASVAAICSALSRGAQPPGQRESDLFPLKREGARDRKAAVRCRERLGGLLEYYEREAA
jgi:hypothetical protein